MLLTRLKQTGCTIYGLGVTGQSCLAYLHKHAVLVSVFEDQPNLAHQQWLTANYPDVAYYHDSQYLLASSDVILSPGVSTQHQLVQLLKKQKVNFYTELDLFSEVNQTSCMAITGTNGKSTVTRWCTQILCDHGIKALAGGNIGCGFLALLSQSADALVLEVSSAQLAQSRLFSANLATVLNMSQDHLDWHGGITHYHNAKQQLLIGAKKVAMAADVHIDDVSKVVVSYGPQPDQQGLSHFYIKHDNTGDWIMCNDQPVINCQSLDVSIRGDVDNLLATCAMCYGWGVSIAKIACSLTHLMPLPHRRQILQTNDGLVWMNDSKATNFHAVAYALKRIKPSQHRLYLILGGQLKPSEPFNLLQDALNNRQAQVVLFGNDIVAFQQQLDQYRISCLLVNQSLEGVISELKLRLNPGDVILFSPGGRSYDQYANFEERGRRFQQLVLAEE